MSVEIFLVMSLMSVEIVLASSFDQFQKFIRLRWTWTHVDEHVPYARTLQPGFGPGRDLPSMFFGLDPEMHVAVVAVHAAVIFVLAEIVGKFPTEFQGADVVRCH